MKQKKIEILKTVSDLVVCYEEEEKFPFEKRLKRRFNYLNELKYLLIKFNR